MDAENKTLCDKLKRLQELLLQNLMKRLMPKHQCRYCLEPDRIGNLLSLCACRGSVMYVHKECLLRWIFQRFKNHQISGNQIVNCEICKYPMRMWFKAPKWFPFVLSTRAFWKMLADLTFILLGMLLYVRELIQLRIGRERRCSSLKSFVKVAYMSITSGFFGISFTIDKNLFRRPIGKFRLWSIVKDLITLTRMVTFVSILVRWMKKLHTIACYYIRAITTERLRCATWTFDPLNVADVRES